MVETIVKAAFSEDVLSDYNELYYECSVEFIKKAVADGVCTKEDGHKTFEHQDNQKVRLDLLKSFIEKQSALYNMGVQPSQGNSKVKKDQGSHGAHLVNDSEKSLCPLCQTPHKDDRGRARKYFSTILVQCSNPTVLRGKVTFVISINYADCAAIS